MFTYLLPIEDKNPTQWMPISELITTGTGTMWKFSSQVMDEVVGNPVLDNGHVTFNVSAQAAKLIKF
ncbi:MAG: hypothetical protein BRC44_15210 [Cyanobacteria bacterium QS_4_48_99]|nr:MAG: hypothetical protein BRC44_15210 [Cyanobacteria bacterium QS_4_48_99]